MSIADSLSSDQAIVLGAGKQAALVLDLIEWMGQDTRQLVFYDDRVKTGGVGPRGRSVNGTMAEGVALAIASKLPTFVALGSKVSALRHWIRSGLERRRVPLPNLVHPSTIIAPNVKLGTGVTIFAGAILGPNVRVESGAILFNRCTLEHDTLVGENVWMAPGVTTSGFVEIGSHCFVGCGSVLSREAKIGKGTLVGAGSVVVHDLPDFQLAFGIPARARSDVRPGMDAPTAADLEACSAGAFGFLA